MNNEKAESTNSKGPLGDGRSASKDTDKPQPKETGEMQQLREKLLRALADAENARKRADRARSEGRETGIAEAVSCLIPALDNFELAIAAVKSKSGQSGKEEDVLLDGLTVTARAFREALTKLGVEIIAPQRADMLDPNLHEAISKVPYHGLGEGQIAEVVQSGYKIGSRLIRPARVIVAESGQSS